MKKKLHKTHRQMMSGSMKVVALVFALTTLLSMHVSAIDYPITIAGITVTDANKNDVRGDGGTVKYDPATKTITLTNANINGGSGSAVAISEPASTGNYTIKLIGDNTVYCDDRAIYGKCSSLTIQGINDGSLEMSTASVPLIGIHAFNADLIIKDCNIIAIGHSDVIAGNSAAGKTITIDNANVETSSYGTDVEPISGFASMILTHCKMTLPANGIYTNNQLQVDGSVYYGNVKIIRVYPIQVAGIDVTEENKDAVPIVSGYAIYNPDTRTLKLEGDATEIYANNNNGIYISAPVEDGVEYTIYGCPEQDDYFPITATGEGTYNGISSTADLALTGWLDIEGVYLGVSMGNWASLTIKNAGIRAYSPGQCGISGSGGDLIIENSEVIILSGGVRGFGNISLIDSYIHSPAGAVVDGGAIKLNGSEYYDEIVIKKSPVGVDLKEASVNNAWATSGTLHIEYNQSTKATAEVFSLIGAKVANIPLSTGINSQAIDRGIYIVRIGNETHKVNVE